MRTRRLREYRQVDTAAVLARCIKELNRFLPPPDFVVISGDLVDAPSKEAYDHLLALLSPLEIPFAAVPGNHDDRALMRADFARRYARPSGALHSLRAIGHVDVVLVDSTTSGRDYGTLGAESLAWLEGVLAASPSRPDLLFMHHPPFVTGIRHMDVQNLRDAGELASVVRQHPRVRLVAAGHVHRATLTNFVGTAATICPAPNHAVALDLDARPAAVFHDRTWHFICTRGFPATDWERWSRIGFRSAILKVRIVFSTTTANFFKFALSVLRARHTFAPFSAD